MDRIEQLKNALADRGKRWSESRETIARIFFQLEGHHSADDIIRHVQETHPQLGQATIYRTLNLLVETGFADSHHFGNQAALFEVADDDHHDHIICLASGQIIEFHDEQIEYLQDEIARKHGYKITSHCMELYGLTKPYHDHPKYQQMLGSGQDKRDPLERFELYLTAHHHKSSLQRTRVAEIFLKSQQHWTIPELLQAAQAEGARVGQATLYRTLALLVEAGLAIPHRFQDKPVSYEPTGRHDAHHDHLICEDTGRVIEFYDASLEAHQERIAKTHDVILIDHRMEIYGRPL